MKQHVQVHQDEPELMSSGMCLIPKFTYVLSHVQILLPSPYRLPFFSLMHT